LIPVGLSLSDISWILNDFQASENLQALTNIKLQRGNNAQTLERPAWACV
jgi:hypothetical protein